MPRSPPPGSLCLRTERFTECSQRRPEEALELRLWGGAPPEECDEFRHSLISAEALAQWCGAASCAVISVPFFGVLRKGRHMFTFPLPAKIPRYFLALSNGGLGFTMDNFFFFFFYNGQLFKTS